VECLRKCTHVSSDGSTSDICFDAQTVVSWKEAVGSSQMCSQAISCCQCHSEGRRFGTYRLEAGTGVFTESAAR
jgi:hypothetical protein